MFCTLTLRLQRFVERVQGRHKGHIQGWLGLAVYRVPHGYGNTHGVSKTGNVGTGTVLYFGTPRTCTAVSWVFTG